MDCNGVDASVAVKRAPSKAGCDVPSDSQRPAASKASGQYTPFLSSMPGPCSGLLLRAAVAAFEPPVNAFSLYKAYQPGLRSLQVGHYSVARSPCIRSTACLARAEA